MCRGRREPDVCRADTGQHGLDAKQERQIKVPI